MTSPQTPDRSATGGAVLRSGVTEAITEAALAELASVGYARMSMERVARRAGVGKAALYRRWPGKQAMLTDLIRDQVAEALPPEPSTGALHGDLREMLAAFRGQLSDPFVAAVGLGLLAESRHDDALAEMLQNAVATPRRAAARAVLQSAIGRGQLPVGLDLDIGLDLLIAPLGFRILVTGGDTGDQYLDTLAHALEAALRACS